MLDKDRGAHGSEVVDRAAPIPSIQRLMLLNDKPSTSASAIGPSLTCTPNSPVRSHQNHTSTPPVRPFPEPKEGRHYVEVYVVKNGLVVATDHHEVPIR
jgi:hypothetical protein